jgi:xanthine dehydrogenase accessory factor
VHDTLAARAAELSRGRVPFVHATVVRAQHPTSAHAGDTALVLADGSIEGFVGGTCARSTLQAHGLAVLRTGEPLLLRILPGVAATTSEDGAVTVANPCLSGGAVEIFLEPRRPAPRILVVGDAPVAKALLTLAETLGFLGESVEGDQAIPSPDDAALVVASHGQGEEPALEAALRAGVPYVGLVASRVRAAAVLAALDVDDELRSKVHSPAGLAIGARTAAEIALSILAELVAQRGRERAPVAAVEQPPGTAVDPVCGMIVSTDGDVISAEHDGGRVFFCSRQCRDAYVDDPVRYASVS